MGDKTGALLLYDCLKLRISWLAHRGGNLRCGRADVCVRLYYPDADSDVVGGNCLLYGKSGYEVCDQEDCGSSLLVFQGPLSMLYAGLLENSGPQLQTVIRPAVTALDKAVRSAGGCTTALTMILIGMMLAEVKAKDIVNRDALGISAVRLGILPFLVLIGCRILCVDPFLARICVLITGMPAGSTSAILAAKYGCDYVFATKCVVVSTLLSMVTIPLWCMADGRYCFLL